MIIFSKLADNINVVNEVSKNEEEFPILIQHEVIFNSIPFLIKKNPKNR